MHLQAERQVQVKVLELFFCSIHLCRQYAREENRMTTAIHEVFSVKFTLAHNNSKNIFEGDPISYKAFEHYRTNTNV